MRDCLQLKVLRTTFNLGHPAAEVVHEPAVREQYRSSLEESARRLCPLLADVVAAEGRSTDYLDSAAAAIRALVPGMHHLDGAAPGLAPPCSWAPLARQMIAGVVDAQPPARQGIALRDARPKRRRR